MKHLLSLLLCVTTIVISQQKTQSVDERVNVLLKKMTLDEKIGQMVQADYDAIKNNASDVVKYSLGSILWGGNSEVKDISAKGWAEVYDSLQRLSLKTKLKVPIIFGIDAVHGHNNVVGAVLFPHNVGLGATNNPALLEKIGAATAKEIRSTGIHWTFAPCVAVARNERWGRTYESFGEDPALVALLGSAFLKGLQGTKLTDKYSTLGCVKHFVADGGTANGFDQGDLKSDEATLRAIHLPGYVEAVKAGAKSIMASYNSWNGNKMHGHKYLMTTVLKDELKFEGFIVSDWAAIDHLPGDYKDDIQQSVNAGMDMVMIPNGPWQGNNYIDFIRLTKELVKEKKIEMSRIDDAVKRILKVKFELGLFENPFVEKSEATNVGAIEHREVAREAVRQSLVLLKNDAKVLPISKTVKSITLVGVGADDIGMQCGGWTIDWQGKLGNVTTGGTTLLQAVKNTVSSGTKVKYSVDGNGIDSGDVVIVVVGEKPYAEFMGDRDDLHLIAEDAALIVKAKSKGNQVITILFSGRPMILESELKNSTAFVAAWLPGTEGQGIADVLFGDVNFTGKLSHTWPKSMCQLPINVGDKNYDPLFPFGFGLRYEK